MKKMMTSFLLVSLIMLSTIAAPAAAATLPDSTSIPRSERLERRQDILHLRIAMLDKQLACLRLARENSTLRIELSKLLKDNRDFMIPEETEALKAINQEIKGLADQLRGTHSDIRSLLDAFHGGTPPTRPCKNQSCNQTSQRNDPTSGALSRLAL